LVAPSTAPVVAVTAAAAAGEAAVLPNAQPSVQWVDNVDFWIAQAIHAGSGDRSTGPQGKQAGKKTGKHAGKRAGKDVTDPTATDDDYIDDSSDADLPGATLSEFDGVRYLHLGDTPWVQGAMRLRKPAAIELDYVQRMCAWLLWRTAEPDMHVVQLGLGAAALTRHAHGVLGLRTTAVELNPQVVSACRAWFHLPPNDERLQVIVSDAGAWIAAPERAASIDVLTVDLYDHQAAAPVLDDAEFYAACHRALKPGGFMTVNLFGRKASFARSAARIAAVFGAPHCLQVSPTAEGNTIAIARRADAGEAGLSWVDADGETTLAERAAQITQLYKLPAARWLRLLKPLVAPPAATKASKKADKKAARRVADKAALATTDVAVSTTTTSSAGAPAAASATVAQPADKARPAKKASA
jgi:spermidine synthase